MNLGKLKVEKSQWRKLAFALEGRLSGQGTLIEDPRVASEAERVLANYDFYRLRKKKEDAPVSIIPLKIGLKFYMNIENFMMIIYPDKILLIYYNC